MRLQNSSIRVATLLSLCWGAAVAAETVTLQRGVNGNVEDAYLWATSPDSNSNSSRIMTGNVSGGNKRGLLRFDLSQVPDGAHVESALLSLTPGGGGPNLVRFHRFQLPWEETTVTWNSVGGATAFDSEVVATYDPSAGPQTLDVTSLVQLWVNGEPNHGFLLEEDFDPAVQVANSIYSSDHTEVSARPRLVVNWVLIADAGTSGGGGADGGLTSGDGSAQNASPKELVVGCSAAGGGALPLVLLLLAQAGRRLGRPR